MSNEDRDASCALDELRGEQLLPVPKAIHKAGVPMTNPTAYRLIRQGKIASVRVGGKVYTSAEEILRFVERCSAKAGEGPLPDGHHITIGLERMDIEAENERLRATIKTIDAILGGGPTLIWTAHTTEEGVKALSDEVVRLRHVVQELRQRQRSDLDERDATNPACPPVDAARRPHDVRARLGE